MNDSFLITSKKSHHSFKLLQPPASFPTLIYGPVQDFIEVTDEPRIDPNLVCCGQMLKAFLAERFQLDLASYEDAPPTVVEEEIESVL